jgi:predicted transcriptional regulator
MARGKKTSNEMIYKVMLSYITTRNYSETGRLLDVPESTVRKIIDDNREKPEFAILCEEKRDEFVEKADAIIYKATELLERRLDTALEKQEEIENLMDEIMLSSLDSLGEKQKLSIVNKLGRLQLNNLSEITTALGTMYDKRALAKGESTSNEKLTINVELSD